jgi:hypothetical protein
MEVPYRGEGVPMTGRVCAVHGEWSAIGVCRWCEPTLPSVEVLTQKNPAPDAALRQAKVKDAIPCRCGEYFWMGSQEERKAVVNGVAHSPEQCFKLAGEPPDAEALRIAHELLGAPPDAAKILRTYKPEFLTRIGYDWTRGPAVEDLADAPLAVCSFDLEDALQELWRRVQARAATMPVYVPDFDAEAARLRSEHAALRWERVARRWNWKLVNRVIGKVPP